MTACLNLKHAHFPIIEKVKQSKTLLHRLCYFIYDPPSQTLRTPLPLQFTINLFHFTSLGNNRMISSSSTMNINIYNKKIKKKHLFNKNTSQI